MKVLVINGTEKRGVTYRLKETFLSLIKVNTEVTEYYLPKDCPNFCIGCTNCFMKGEKTCKDSEFIQTIEKSILEADLLVFTSPSYVMHTTGAMKALLDHFGYRWMLHRPAKEMFGKRAIIITQCLGAGGKSTAKDIKDSLSWWGIPYIKVSTTALMSEIVWDKLSEKKRKNIEKKLFKLVNKINKIKYDKPAHTNITCKFKFMLCRIIQKQIFATNKKSIDAQYWNNNGWLKRERPWKR